MPRVTFARRAQIDLAEIAAFIGERNPRAAHRLLIDIRDTCRRVAGYPAMGRGRDRLMPGLRSHPHGSCVIFYRPLDAAFTE